MLNGGGQSSYPTGFISTEKVIYEEGLYTGKAYIVARRQKMGRRRLILSPGPTARLLTPF